MNDNKVIFWDFDGTLGYREGDWEDALFQIMKKRITETKANRKLVSDRLEKGFPWHQPEKNYSKICNSKDWWAFVEPVFVNIFKEFEFNAEESEQMSQHVSSLYADYEKWKLFEDAEVCLKLLQANQWTQVLVTNNIPEFPGILQKLGIDIYFDAVFVSSLCGYNKPNPLILNSYLDTLPDNAMKIVVGDREESDLVFAGAIGAEGIMVRTQTHPSIKSFRDLSELETYLLSFKPSQDV